MAKGFCNKYQILLTRPLSRSPRFLKHSRIRSLGGLGEAAEEEKRVKTMEDDADP